MNTETNTAATGLGEAARALSVRMQKRAIVCEHEHDVAAMQEFAEELSALAAQPTPTMWNALNGNDPLPTPAQPADIALAVGEDLYKALERRAVFAKCIQGDLLAIPLLTTLALVSDANKRNPNPVAWQVRHFFAGGYWSGWAQAPSEDEAKAVVARHAKAGTQAEYRRLYDAPAQPAPGVGGDA